MTQKYHSIATQGGGRIAYVFHVSGYPWAVCTDPDLVTAVYFTGVAGNAEKKYIREKIFGACKWTPPGEGADDAPAWHAPIFSTLIDDFGTETWSADETKGTLRSTGWRVKIQNKPLGEDWTSMGGYDYKTDGDELHGLDGVDRVARLEDSSVHGWGFLDSPLLTDDGAGDPPTTISIVEESNSKIYTRVDGLDADKWIPLWIDHECIAVRAIDSGSFAVETAYDLEIADSGVARGLYKSRPAVHLVGTDRDIVPIIADVPGSIAGEYGWLYGIPLTEDGSLVYDSDGNPIIAEECRGIVSQDITSSGNVTSIKMLDPLQAAKVSTETQKWVQERDYETHLAKYIVRRGENSGTIEDAIVPYWQCPHLIILRYGYLSEEEAGAQDRRYGWEKIPIWLCSPGQTRTFDTYEEIFEAVQIEVSKVWWNHHDQKTGQSSTGNFARPELTIYGEWLGIGGYELEPRFANKALISGPLAWVLGLGAPGVSGWREDEIPRTYSDPFTDGTRRYVGDVDIEKLDYSGTFLANGFDSSNFFELELVGRKMSSEYPVWNPEEWLMVPTIVGGTPVANATKLILEETPGFKDARYRAPYYCQWDWNGNPPDDWEHFVAWHQYPNAGEMHSSTTFPIAVSKGTDRLWLDDGTDDEAFVDTEIVYFGSGTSRSGVPRLKGELDGNIQEDSDDGSLYIELDSDELETIDNEVIPQGCSLVYLPYGQEDEVSDPRLVSKALDLEGNKFSDVIRTLFGESRSPLVLAPELALDHVPFFTTSPPAGDYAVDFESMLDWTSMDAVITPFAEGQSYVLDTSKLKNIYDIIRNEVLLHGGAMTREWDHTNLCWKIRFRSIDAMNQSAAFYEGRTLTEDCIRPGRKKSDLNAEQIANVFEIEPNTMNFKIIGDRTATIQSDRTTVKIQPSVSYFHYEPELIQERSLEVADETGRHLIPVLRTLSRRSVSQSANLTRRGFYRAVLGRESLITDPAARLPHTNALGVTNEACRIIKWSRNLAKNTLNVTYSIGGDASYGFAPACRMTTGNFTEHTTYWWGVPEDHDFSEDYQAKDMYRFDCYDLLDPDNPTTRSCSCGEYAVHAIEEHDHGATVLDFTAALIDDGGTLKLRLTGSDTSSIDTDANYIIYFADYDDCEVCQRYYIFGADQTNRLGTSNLAARRWVG